jgi:hypothetical protein
MAGQHGIRRANFSRKQAMTDVDTAASVAAFAAWRTEYERVDAAKRIQQANANAHNRPAILAELAKADIARVDVRFDGYGDSGQIEETNCSKADNAAIDMPDVSIDLAVVLHDGSGIEIEPTSLALAIEHFCYDALESDNDGWENNEGAYGDFAFDVAAGTITYTHNTRYVSEETSVAEL